MVKIDYWQILINTIKLAIAFWPLWVILLAIVAIRLFFYWLDLEIDNWHIRRRFKKGEQWRSDQDLIRWLRGMEPSEFEEYIAQLYSKLGYKTERVGGGYDGGVDVIAEKNGIKYYIQCKKYITSTVGVKEIREFYGVLVDHTAQGKGIFITTNIFSSEAEYFSKDKPIELIDGQKLVRLIRQIEKTSK